MTTAPGGVSTVAPTARIFPSANAIAPLRIVGPAAVMMLTFRITYGADDVRMYVLGNGSAFGSDVEPGPLPAAVVSLLGVGACPGGAVRHADSATKALTTM